MLFHPTIQLYTSSVAYIFETLKMIEEEDKYYPEITRKPQPNLK